MNRRSRWLEWSAGAALALLVLSLAGLWLRREWLTRQLATAMSQNRWEAALTLAHAGASGDVLLPDGDLALSRAVEHPELVRALLAHGARPDRPSAQGWRPLDIAVINYQPEAVELLLHAGAAANRPTPDGEPHLALLFAYAPYNIDAENRALLIRQQDRIMEALLRHGANPNVAPLSGETPLALAITRGEPHQWKRLLSAGADPNPALEAAVRTRKTEAVDSLLKAGANPRRRTSSGHTLLQVAQKHGFNEGAHLLRAAGARD